MDGTGGSTDMTLAFELSALRRLGDPGAVFDGARRWTEYVGVVSDEPTYVVTNFTRKHRIRQDFFSGPRGKAESLDAVREQFDTERHVLVSAAAEDAELAEEVGWEFLPVEDAAAAADWDLQPPGAGEDGPGGAAGPTGPAGADAGDTGDAEDAGDAGGTGDADGGPAGDDGAADGRDDAGRDRDDWP